MSMCFKTEYDSNGNDIWKGVTFTAPPGGNKPPATPEIDKKVQAILKKIKYSKDS